MKTLRSSLLLAAWLAIPAAHGGVVVGAVFDKAGKPVADAVVFAMPLEGAAPAVAPNTTVIVAQENYAFVPYVSVVQSGTQVRFPNRDEHDHHLKSFSPAKSFSLKTYGRKQEPEPVLFDKSGEVALVCHIHSWMRGFIYVVDTPWFGKTDTSGNAVIANIPPGKYEIKAWAPTMLSAPLTRPVQVQANGSTDVRFQLDFTPRPAPKAPKKTQWEDNYHVH